MGILSVDWELIISGLVERSGFAGWEHRLALRPRREAPAEMIQEEMGALRAMLEERQSPQPKKSA
jgi:hypothetical protein